jgi:FG-GAP-like repeat/Cep192 domain 4
MSATVLAQSSPTPLIDLPLVPTSVTPGGPTFALTVNGAGFVTDSVVNWNGYPRPTKFISKTRLTTEIPAEDIAKAGTGSITVANPGSANPTSNVAFLSVVAPVKTVAFAGSRFSTFGNPWYSVSGDFNGDGFLDLAVSNWETNLAVLLGNGDGTFQRALTDSSASDSGSLASGDFNGDGKLDLAVTNTQGTTVSVFLGNGDGTFQPPVGYVTTTNPGSLVVGDVNRDGKLDLLVIGAYDAQISILLGNGDGTFQAQTILDTAGGQICLGDFNGDGVLDIGIANQFNTAIYLGKGDGSFLEPKYYAGINSFPQSLVTADLNGDGILDLVIGGWNGIGVLLGEGRGGFGTPTNYTTGNTSYDTATVVDLNGDGKPDIAVANSSDNTIAVLLGNGDGTFQQPSYFEAGVFSLAITFGDFNGDGAMDLALSAYGFPGSAGAFISQQTSGAAVLFSPAVLSFPVQVVGTQSTVQSIKMTNVGKETLDITRIGISGTDPSAFSQTNNCGTRVAAGDSCDINLTFAPRNRGPRPATLVVADSAVNGPQSVPLIGTATWASLSPTSLNFGNQKVGTVSVAQSITLTNVGSGSMAISQVGIVGATPRDFRQTNNCGNALAAHSRCTINIQFAPTRLGSFNDRFEIKDNGGGTVQKVPVSGIGN